VKRLDPLALAFFGAAVALLAGLVLYVLFFKRPEPAAPAGSPGTLESLRAAAENAVDRLSDKPAPAPKAPRAQSARPVPSPGDQAGRARGGPIQAGRTWRYAVVVEPPVWRDITLTYTTRSEGSAIAVHTDFVHAAGKMAFDLGTFAAWHPSHANTRFPGFFMYASYFPLPLEPGQQFSWGWPWQSAGKGSMKRYVAKVLRWEQVQVPAGTYRAAVIDVTLSYMDAARQARAQTKETLWYAPDATQLVKVVREGRSPDEGSTRIVAELAELR
jgi:hypothetical protein